MPFVQVLSVVFGVEQLQPSERGLQSLKYYYLGFYRKVC